MQEAENTTFSLQPDSPVIGHFLEETAIVDWQTPAVAEQARALAGPDSEERERVEAAFRFVRDAIAAPPADGTTLACSAGQVLARREGLSFARSHLLVALLRAAGLPAGFLYQRVTSLDAPPRPVLYGLAAVQLDGRWLPLDAGGESALEGSRPLELDLAEPRLSHECDPARGLELLPTLFSKPSRRILDLLQRAPGVAAALAHRPDAP